MSNSSITRQLSITEIASLLTDLWKRPNSPPVLLIGPPGGGKTSIIGQIAKHLNYHSETLMGNTLEPSDVAGIPYLKGEQMILAPPAWAIRVKEAATHGHAVLNFDELNTARPATLAALLRVILERRVGDVDLGPKVHIVATMNPAEEAAHGWELPPAVANRFLHLNVAPTSVADWQKWAASQDESPEYHKLAAEFPLPTLYSTPESGPFASPRSWHFALRAAAAMMQVGKQDLVGTVVAAAVSPGIALSWSDAQKLDFGNTSRDWSSVDAGELAILLDRMIEEMKARPDDTALRDKMWQMVHDASPHHASTLYVKLGAHKSFLRTHTGDPDGIGVKALKKIQEIVK